MSRRWELNVDYDDDDDADGICEESGMAKERVRIIGGGGAGEKECRALSE